MLITGIKSLFLKRYRLCERAIFDKKCEVIGLEKSTKFSKICSSKSSLIFSFLIMINHNYAHHWNKKPIFEKVPTFWKEEFLIKKVRL